MNHINPTGKTDVNATFRGAGIGYAIVPNDLEYFEYVKICFRTSTISLCTEDGEFMHNVPVDSNAMKNIRFPVGENNKLGTTVVWVYIPAKGGVIVIASLLKNDEMSENTDENSFMVSRGNVDGTVLFSINGNDNSISLSALNSTNKPSNINLTVGNGNDTSGLNLKSNGNLNVAVSKKFNIQVSDEFSVLLFGSKPETQMAKISYKLGVGLTISDENGNSITTDKDGFNIKNSNTNSAVKMDKNGNVSLVNSVGKGVFMNKQVIKIGAENSAVNPMVLGNALAQTLGELIDAITRITVTTPSGPSTLPILNLSEFQTIKSKLSEILSKITFTE